VEEKSSISKSFIFISVPINREIHFFY